MDDDDLVAQNADLLNIFLSGQSKWSERSVCPALAISDTAKSDEGRQWGTREDDPAIVTRHEILDA